jgi:DHA1 family inner membrane transport protein
MAFFRNNTVNLLNLHYGIHSVALTGGGALYIVYLLKAGVPVAGVLGALALILAGRFAVRPIVVPLAVRFGVRRLVIAGTFMSAMQYPIVAEVHGIGWPLLILCLVSSAGDAVYWSCYHAYFAALGDRDERGSQIGIREAISACVGIVSPIVTSGMLVAFGPRVAFAVTAVVLTTAALPLLYTPNVRVTAQVPGAYKAARSGGLLFACDGWTCAGFYFTWQIALFLSLGQNFLAFGGALAIAALAGAAGGLVLGRVIDAGHGTRAVWLAYGGFFIVTVLRAVAPGHQTLAIVANALGSLSACLYIPTMMTAVYNQAKQSPCSLRFHVFSEGGWDIGGASGCLFIALLTWAGVPLSVGVLTSLMGAAVGFVILRRYYLANPSLEAKIASMEVPLPQAPPV